MRQRNLSILAGIVILTLAAIWVNLPNNPGIHIHLGPIHFDKDIRIHQGLDLQGGMQVLLEADLPEGEEVDPGAMAAARVIVENRVNALGVTEPLVQLQGDRRIIVELPGIEDPELAIATIKETGLLEFIDTGGLFLEPGTVVKTTFATGEGEAIAPTPSITATGQVTPTAATPTAEATISPTAPVTPTAQITPTAEATPTVSTERVFTTVMTGKELDEVGVALDRFGKPEIRFSLKPEGARIFADFTSKNVGKFLAIVLDKRVISCPRIETPITEGSGRITGKFTLEEARSLAVQLRYGALPVPLRVETVRTVGPTLGRDSIHRSVRAGTIGLLIVLTFMVIYYRLPGFLACLALIIYGLLNFALFKLIPVTLTMPGITGFLLSTATAVDANILIFERMKEELRWGRSLGVAINAGFDRAWTSIRDSNLSTIITCAILYWFGSNFGASIVKGFAITLFIGVMINMFTAITVTRTFISFVFDLAGDWLRDRKWLLGV
ncbi:MAG TPA: protein translocase subunit SecD [Anaerolineae bacterium]|nr:protein translocase subunit SecD [Anaerolineae bacterium]